MRTCFPRGPAVEWPRQHSSNSFRTKLLYAILATALASCGTGPAGPVTNSLQSDSSSTAAPIDTYARIARGANLCWFGANGPLKATHIFQADVKPASEGGTAEIAIHERVSGQLSPLGFVAFRVNIRGSQTYSEVATDNLRMPEAMAAMMRSDIESWTNGGSTCSAQQLKRPSDPGVSPAPAKR